MEHSVIVQSDRPDHFIAFPIGIPDVRAEGATSIGEVSAQAGQLYANAAGFSWRCRTVAGGTLMKIRSRSIW